LHPARFDAISVDLPLIDTLLGAHRMKYLALASSRARLGPAAALVLLLAAGCGASGAGSGAAGAGAAQGTGGSAGVGGGLAGTGGAPSAPALRAAGVAVGAAHSCALLLDGRVACWGDGAHGQLGDGMSGAGYVRTVPAVVPGLAGVKAIRAGGDTTCALTGSAAVCWGDGAFGQLGDGMSGDGYRSATPVAVAGLDAVVDLSVSGTNACAARADGTVRCWGRNAPEQWLGFDSTDCGPYSVTTGQGPATLVSIPCEPSPRKVPGAGGAVAVASGGEHNCARLDAGGASCWGADNFGQLGDAMSGLDAHNGTPSDVQGLGKVRILALGSAHTCGVVGDALAVRCWGDNSYGQLGLGTKAIDSYKTTPTEVVGVSGVVDLDAAGQTTCAVLSDGTVSCWGDTSTVLPVSPSKGGALLPTPVPGVAGVVEARTGGAHVCARMTDAGVVCWGLGDRGQLGNGSVHIADFSLAPVGLADTQGGPG
jgi:alpha-tubulin suppressor-like RCC1 family protein